MVSDRWGQRALRTIPVAFPRVSTKSGWDPWYLAMHPLLTPEEHGGYQPTTIGMGTLSWGSKVQLSTSVMPENFGTAAKFVGGNWSDL
jgi:hypothetical protein